MSIDFSIIVPVYNAKNSIVTCLKSIQEQTLRSFEVIVIDDGSSDNSGNLCDSIAESDSRFHVIHQNNKGVSYARNVGLDTAAGTFISFVDADDTVTPDYLESLQQKFIKTHSDVVFIGYSKYFSKSETEEKRIPSLHSSEYLQQLCELSEQDHFGYTWIKSFRRECISDIRFREDINLFEDEIFTCNVLQNCNSISILKKAVYRYICGNEGALMSKTHQDYCILQDQVYTAWANLINGIHESNEILTKKANSLATACEYYLYERDISVDTFIESIINSTFVINCLPDTPFIKAVHNNDIRAIKKMRIVYRAKVKLYNALKKIK